MGGMVFQGGAVAVVGAVSRSVIHWAGLILPDFALLLDAHNVKQVNSYKQLFESEALGRR